jgi:hypothetical protein
MHIKINIPEVYLDTCRKSKWQHWRICEGDHRHSYSLYDTQCRQKECYLTQRNPVPEEGKGTVESEQLTAVQTTKQQ